MAEQSGQETVQRRAVFAPIGIGDSAGQVHTPRYRDPAAVVSEVPLRISDRTGLGSGDLTDSSLPGPSAETERT